MSSFVKLAAVLTAGLLATVSAAEKTGDDKSKKPDTKESGDKKAKKDKDKKKDKAPADPNAPPKAIEVPMPNGRDAKVLNIPYRDNGKLKMRFLIGVALKTDDTHMDMSDLQIETFDDEEKHEMTIDLPTSTLDLTTAVITAHHPVKIRRDDFELTGDSMIFNTRTKQGGVGGNVRMTIFDLDEEAPKTPSAKSPDAEKPAAATPNTPEPNAK